MMPHGVLFGAVLLVVLPWWLYYAAKSISMGWHVGVSRSQTVLRRMNKYNE